MRGMAGCACRVRTNAVKALQRRLRVAGPARARSIARVGARSRRSLQAVRAMTRLAALLDVRVERVGLVLVAARARRAGAQRSRVSIVAARARRVALRCRPRFVRMAGRTRRLRHGSMRVAVARAAGRMAGSGRRRLDLVVVTVRTERCACAREGEPVRRMARRARGLARMECVIVLRVRVTRAACGCCRDRRNMRDVSGCTDDRCAVAVRRVATRARLLALRRPHRRMRRLDARVAAHARRPSGLLRPMRIVAARALRVGRDPRGSEHADVRVTRRRARGPCFARCVRGMAAAARRVSLDGGHSLVIGMTFLARTDVSTARAMWLVTRDARFVTGDTRTSWSDPRRGAHEGRDRRWMRTFRSLDGTMRTDVAPLARAASRFLPRMRSVTHRADLTGHCGSSIDRAHAMAVVARSVRLVARERRRARLAHERENGGVEREIQRGDARRRACVNLECAVRGARVPMARRAVREHRVLLAVDAVTGSARQLGARVMLEGRRARRSMFLRVAVVARRRGLVRAEDVAGQASRGALFATVVMSLRLRAVAFRASARRRSRVRRRVALGARDLLRSDVQHVHRRLARILPRRRDELDGRHRRRSIGDRQDGEGRGSDDREDEKRESATACRHGR